MSQQTSSTPRLTAFAPVSAENSTTLILGSMPGQTSLDVTEYYAHPRNAFWPIMSQLLKLDGESYESRLAKIIQCNLALWDVMQHCKRPGSLDASIEKESIVCNDFSGFLATHRSIDTIIFNGKTAETVFRKQVLPTLFSEPDHLDQHSGKNSPSFHVLPSTSPAHASMTSVEKAAEWLEVLRKCSLKL